MQQWEYRVQSFYNDQAGDARADELGAEGWELVCVDRHDQWIFKRPVEIAIARTIPQRKLEKLSVRGAASAGRHNRRTS